MEREGNNTGGKAPEVPCGEVSDPPTHTHTSSLLGVPCLLLDGTGDVEVWLWGRERGSRAAVRLRSLLGPPQGWNVL